MACNAKLGILYVKVGEDKRKGMYKRGGEGKIEENSYHRLAGTLDFSSFKRKDIITLYM